MYNFLFIVLAAFLCSCFTKSRVTKNDRLLVGQYKQVSGTHYEILKLKKDYTLTSIFSYRLFKWEKFKEYGEWNTNFDTLIIERIRHDSLKKLNFPEKQKFIIRNKKLYELILNYKQELFETQDSFEKK